MVAEDYVFEAAGVPPQFLEGIAAAGNGPDDALRLAARFYVLAAALCTLLPIGGRFDWQSMPRGRAFRPAATGCARGLSGWTREPHDTS